MPNNSAARYAFIDSNNLQLKYHPTHGWSANLLAYGIKFCSCGYFNPFETLKCKGCGEILIITDSPDPVTIGEIMRRPSKNSVTRFFIGTSYKDGVRCQKVISKQFKGDEFEFKKKYPNNSYTRILNKDEVQFWTRDALRRKVEEEKSEDSFIQIFDSLNEFRKWQAIK